MQNKPNLPDTQMNISSVNTEDYENIQLFRGEKNKPKQTQFQTRPCKNRASLLLLILFQCFYSLFCVLVFFFA